MSHNEQAATQRRSDWRAEEDRAILREHIQSLMADPRYETSTLFRKQVREQIEANPHLFGQRMPSPTRVNGRVQLSSEHLAEIQAAIAKEKQDKREAEAKAAADRAAKLAAKYSFSVTVSAPMV